MKLKKKPLEVRRHIGRLAKQCPRTEMKCGSKWVPCEGFAAAREYAAVHGYPGITIKPV